MRYISLLLVAALFMVPLCLSLLPRKGMQQPDNEEYGPEVDNLPMGEDL